MAIAVCGGKKVQGSIKIQGSKNAVLPIMAAAVLSDGVMVIRNCPDISDVHAMSDLLREIGAKVSYDRHCLQIDTRKLSPLSMQAEKIHEIRASVLLLGSVLTRFRKIQMEHPGGCAIGDRPIDFHLKAFKKMGAHIQETEEQISCTAESGLCGTVIRLPYPSVGATENIMLAAVLAKGTTIVENAAREPEIGQLCQCLCAMGAQVEEISTGCLKICGVRKLYPVEWEVGADRIVQLTYAMLAAGCGGTVFLETGESFPKAEQQVLQQLGCRLAGTAAGIELRQDEPPKAIPYLRTAPYPGYPTDGQSLLMAVLSKGRGVSMIEETVFENRFSMIRQLQKMGANIDYVSNHASITGVTKLHGAQVEADDLRSGAGLLIAAAMADGTSIIKNDVYIRRGYEDIVAGMSGVGIDIFWN